jgi:hypothetical protein
VRQTWDWHKQEQTNKWCFSLLFSKQIKQAMNDYLEKIVKRDVANRDPLLFQEYFHKDGTMRKGKKEEAIAAMLVDYDSKTAVYQLWYPSSLQSPQVSAALEKAWKQRGIRNKYTLYIGEDRRISAGTSKESGKEQFYISKYYTLRTAKGAEAKLAKLIISVGQGAVQQQMQLLDLSKDQKIPGFSTLLNVTSAFHGNPSTTALQSLKENLKASRLYFYDIREDAPLQPSGFVTVNRIKLEVMYADLKKREQMLARIQNDANFQLSLQLGAGSAIAPRPLLIIIQSRKIKRDSLKKKEEKAEEAAKDTSKTSPPDGQQSQEGDNNMDVENALQQGNKV